MKNKIQEDNKLKIRYSVFVIIFTLILFMPVRTVMAQAHTLWTKTIGGLVYVGNSVQQTTDGGYIITGHGHTN